MSKNLIVGARLTVTFKKRSAGSDHSHQTASSQPTKHQSQAATAPPSAGHRSGPPIEAVPAP